MDQVPPLSSVYDLSDLSEAGAEIVVSANAGQRARLAQWAGVDEVERFEATVSLRRLGAGRFSYDAKLDADIVQSCVVTLEPVRSHLEREVARLLHLRGPRTERGEPLNAAPQSGDEGREEITSPEFDLAAPLLEELVLAVDPYPRAPGVKFEPPVAEEAVESPFAILKGLKPHGTKP